jgi:hypothetical protein
MATERAAVPRWEHHLDLRAHGWTAAAKEEVVVVVEEEEDQLQPTRRACTHP